MLVAYLRVSTQRQSASGLGLDAQQQAVEAYAKSADLPIIATYTEIESGASSNRPQLNEALRTCRRQRAVLLIARLDRLSRSLAFVARLLEANVEVRAADMPEANRMMLQMLAVFAEHERRLIGERTKAALAAAKARGVRLGANGHRLAEDNRKAATEFASTMAATIAEAQRRGASTHRQIASTLNAQGIPSRAGGRWHAANVGRLLRRLSAQ